jgi:hypothetical protein
MQTKTRWRNEIKQKNRKKKIGKGNLRRAQTEGRRKGVNQEEDRIR